MKFTADAQGQGRFACSNAERLVHEAPPPIASLRLHLTFQRLASLCMDSAAGLDSAVRLRLFLVPESMVNHALKLNELDDDGWGEILAGAGVVMGSMRSMQSIYLMTRRVDSAEARQRILKRLLGQTAA